MKIKELIARLQTLDPEAEILTNYDGDYATSEPLPVPVGITNNCESYCKGYRLKPTDYLFLSDEGFDKADFENWEKFKSKQYEDDYERDEIEDYFSDEYPSTRLHTSAMQESDRQLKEMLKGIETEKMFPNDPDFAATANDRQILHRLGFYVPTPDCRDDAFCIPTPTDGTPI